MYVYYDVKQFYFIHELLVTFINMYNYIIHNKFHFQDFDSIPL